MSPGAYFRNFTLIDFSLFLNVKGYESIKQVNGKGTPTSLSKTDHSNEDERCVPLRL